MSAPSIVINADKLSNTKNISRAISLFIMVGISTISDEFYPFRPENFNVTFLHPNITLTYLGSYKFTCEVCNNGFNNKQYFMQHKERHCKTKLCSLCPMRFKDENRLKKHLQQHKGEGVLFITGEKCEYLIQMVKRCPRDLQRKIIERRKEK